jgi:hypothetical protein
MSVYLDRTFLLKLSTKLLKFTQKKTDLYNFRCPICGDSEKNKNLKRGYIYRVKNDYFYKCHNCAASLNFYQFLEKVEPNSLKEYTLERYKEIHGDKTEEKDTYDQLKHKPKFKQKLKLKSIDKLSSNHIAKQYCLNRQIPEESLSELYYTEDFKSFVESLNIEKDGLFDNDERLVLPFYDKDGNLIALQGRTLTNSKLRYITIKITENSQKYFGLNSIDQNELIYVVEGPIDSLFLKNAIATADSNLIRAAELFDKSKIVLVYDNEPRNKEIVKLMNHAIDEHYSIVIWPQMIECKDINDMILDGFTKEELQDIIEKNTFVNLRAKLEFLNWKKI